jgi:hypothetical protein
MNNGSRGESSAATIKPFLDRCGNLLEDVVAFLNRCRRSALVWYFP